MSMGTHVVGFKPPDEKWRRMKAAWDACSLAGVEVPKEVDEFFGGDPPDERGVEVRLQYLPKSAESPDGLHPALRRWSDSFRDGYEVDVTKLPKDVTILRFYNSW